MQNSPAQPKQLTDHHYQAGVAMHPGTRWHCCKTAAASRCHEPHRAAQTLAPRKWCPATDNSQPVITISQQSPQSISHSWTERSFLSLTIWIIIHRFLSSRQSCCWTYPLSCMPRPISRVQEAKPQNQEHWWNVLGLETNIYKHFYWRTYITLSVT